MTPRKDTSANSVSSGRTRSADPCFALSAISNLDSASARAVGNTNSRILNLGCGLKRLPEAVNVDRLAQVNPDVVHDLNRFPWPFSDAQFEKVFAYDILEHCDDLLAVMEEVHRVCRNGAIVRITVPHFSCANAYSDPTHRHFFGWSSFHYVTGEHNFSFYTAKRFGRRVSRIVFLPSWVNKVIHRLANRYPQTYELRWAWTFPAWFLYFELDVIK